MRTGSASAQAAQKPQGQCEPLGRGPTRPNMQGGGRCLTQGSQRPRQAPQASLQSAPDGRVMRRGTRFVERWGDRAERVVGTWCCAVGQEEPGTLQVWHLRQLSQKGVLRAYKRSVPHARVYSALLSRANGRAQGDVNGLSPRHTSGPSSATRGDAGPPAKLKTRVLPRLAATPVCAPTSASHQLYSEAPSHRKNKGTLARLRAICAGKLSGRCSGTSCAHVRRRPWPADRAPG